MIKFGHIYNGVGTKCKNPSGRRISMNPPVKTLIMNTPPASSLIQEKSMRRYVEVDEDES